MKRTGQSTLEYAVIIAVVVAGFIAMQIYIRRAVQGKLRESTDRIGEQYSAGNVTSKYATEQGKEMKTKETFGLADDGKAPAQGVSRYGVEQSAPVTRSTEAGAEEKIDKKLSEEPLF